MFETNLYALHVLLLHGDIIVGHALTKDVLYRLHDASHQNLGGNATDTIGALCTNIGVSDSTSPSERKQFLEWFADINNIKELHVTLQIQPANQEPLTD